MTVSNCLDIDRKCPIGFRFTWDRDAGTPTEYALVGWMGKTPLFSDGQSNELWSGRLETVAALAFRESRAVPS